VTDATLLQKFEELSGRVATLEAENTRLQQENQLLRQKLEHYIRHYFGGRRNESLSPQQLELLLQGLPNVIALPTPAPKPVLTPRSGTPHPVRRVLAEDKLETEEIVLELCGVSSYVELEGLPPTIVHRHEFPLHITF
jgi:hypothetical protein